PEPTCLPHRTSTATFFSRSRDSRHLHSFPTRRSSDLFPREIPRSDVVLLIANVERHASVVGRQPQGEIGAWRRLEVVARQHSHEDRKSTRLNSSHVAISYAVFCLKKKSGRF